MGRPLRVEFPGAIYHVMSRGNARRPIFHDERDYGRLLEGLETTVDKFGFEVFSYVCMPNHIHLFFRTPEPNLSRGMQYLLSGYANWFATRRRRPGHVFQGRFKGELIEDERYFWNVSRYIHLNPVRGKRPLVERPEDWEWSSYTGYRWKRKRVEWMAYGSVYRAWQGGHGGTRPEEAYRRFVNRGVATPPENPLNAAVEGWLLGSREFVDRIKRLAKAPKHGDEVPSARRLSSLPLGDVLGAVADHYGVAASSFAKKHNTEVSRDVAAWLARRLTVATLRELAEPFGLGHPDSVRNLIRRAEQAMKRCSRLRKEVEDLRRMLTKTENRV
jgi:REP element-mobilizing transposase RayT